MSARTIGTVAAAICGMLSCGSTAGAATRLIALGDLAGGAVSSEATDVSADGLRVVGIGTTDAGAGSFLYDFQQGFFPVTVDLPGTTVDRALAISGDGTTIVGTARTAEGSSAVSAYRHDVVSSQTFPLPVLPGGAVSTASAFGVSGDGQVVVGQSSSGSGLQSVFWSPDDVATGLGLGPEDSILSGEAHAASLGGEVIVGTAASAPGSIFREAYRWTSEGGYERLGYLQPEGFRSSDAVAVSPDGSVVVGGSYVFSQGSFDSAAAYRWTEETGMVSLGTLPDGAGFSQALDVSDDGRRIVGSAAVDGGGNRPFLWDDEHGIRRLTDALLEDYGLDVAGEGWSLLAANAISGDGRAIVGQGVDPEGNTTAFLLFLDDRYPGDANGDDSVDLADFNILKAGFNTFVGPNQGGDFTGDGLVDLADFNLLKANFNTSAPVPEPSTAVLVVVACVGWNALRRRFKPN